MTVKLIPAKPAVVQVIEPAQEAKVQLEVSLHEAYLIRALIGHCTGDHTQEIYRALNQVLNDYKCAEYSKVVHRANGGKNIHLNGVREALDSLKKSL